MITVADCLKLTTKLMAVSGSARLDVEVILAHVLGVERSWLYTWPESQLSSQQKQEFSALLARRIKGEPVAYITGEREFWSLPLKVGPATLIPRPDTETLIEKALLMSLPTHARVLDLGTGTGAIALALAAENPSWEITAVDCEKEAVALAVENASRLNLTNVTVRQSHWFANLAREQYDLIVSNPPYIDEADQHLNQGDVRFEPRSALVSAQQGLSDLQHIIETAPDWLKPEGWLLLEHGFEQGGRVCQLMLDNGFEQVENLKDLAGLERASCGVKPKRVN